MARPGIRRITAVLLAFLILGSAAAAIYSFCASVSATAVGGSQREAGSASRPALSANLCKIAAYPPANDDPTEVFIRDICIQISIAARWSRAFRDRTAS
jgi:hypothetical protein